MLASGIVGLALLLAIPGMAMADPAVAEMPATEAAIPAVEPTPTDALVPADTLTPADEVTPVDEPAPVDAGPIGEDAGAGEAPAPPPSEQAPVLVAPAPDGSATPAPEPEQPVIPETPLTSTPIPGSPDAPALVIGNVDRSPVVTVPAEPADPVVVTPILPSRPEEALAPILGETEPAAMTPLKAAVVPATRAVLPAQLISLDPDRDAFASMAVNEQPRPSVLGEAIPGDPQLTQNLVAPIASGGGSSLLAVLAGYILPGSGSAPPSTIAFLILLGLVLAAIYAPRPQGSERLYLSGLLGPRSGHGMAVRRPG